MRKLFLDRGRKELHIGQSDINLIWQGEDVWNHGRCFRRSLMTGKSSAPHPSRVLFLIRGALRVPILISPSLSSHPIRCIIRAIWSMLTNLSLRRFYGSRKVRARYAAHTQLPTGFVAPGVLRTGSNVRRPGGCTSYYAYSS